MLGVDPFSAGARVVGQIYLQSLTLSPHSSGTQTGKLVAPPQVL